MNLEIYKYHEAQRWWSLYSVIQAVCSLQVTKARYLHQPVTILLGCKHLSCHCRQCHCSCLPPKINTPKHFVKLKGKAFWRNVGLFI